MFNRKEMTIHGEDQSFCKDLICRVLVVGFIFLLTENVAFPQAGKCAAQELLSENLKKNTLKAQWKKNEEALKKWIEKAPDFTRRRSVVTIPVVVHIVWNEPGENIPDERVFSQLAVLNSDFRSLNCEISGIPAEFKSQVADMEIEFCLADRDPLGNQVTGITRTPTSVPRFDRFSGSIFHTSEGGKDAWDTQRYLNIWVADIGGTHGFAVFPGMNTDPGEDGVVISSETFGILDNNTEEPYNLGRTATHEVGHYFNLLHPFFDGGSEPCIDHDSIPDTPVQQYSYSGECPEYPQYSCGSSDMFMNYMNYTADACMAMFTQGQKMRVLAALHELRPGLLEGAGCASSISFDGNFSFFPVPNPAFSEIQFQPSSPFFPKFGLRIFSIDGRVVYEGNSWFSSDKLDISSWQGGVYIAEITCAGQQWTGRFVKF